MTPEPTDSEVDCFRSRKFLAVCNCSFLDNCSQTYCSTSRRQYFVCIFAELGLLLPWESIEVLCTIVYQYQKARKQNKQESQQRSKDKRTETPSKAKKNQEKPRQAKTSHATPRNAKKRNEQPRKQNRKQKEQKLKRKERSRKDKQAERPRKQNDTQARNMTMNPEEESVIGTS